MAPRSGRYRWMCRATLPSANNEAPAAVRLAETHKASVSAIAFEMDIQSSIGFYADPIHVQGILAADRKSAANDHELLDTFESIAAEAGVERDPVEGESC